MSHDMYVVIVESESGLDVFGNPKGKPMVFETIGDMDKNEAIDTASKLQASGRYGKVKIAKLDILNVMIDGVA
jgi:hypothetical protein